MTGRGRRKALGVPNASESMNLESAHLLVSLLRGFGSSQFQEFSLGTPRAPLILCPLSTAATSQAIPRFGRRHGAPPEDLRATVDGRNPAPLGNHFFMGIYSGIIIPGLFRWCRISSIHSMYQGSCSRVFLLEAQTFLFLLAHRLPTRYIARTNGVRQSQESSTELDTNKGTYVKTLLLWVMAKK